jgi:hypothetical protein
MILKISPQSQFCSVVREFEKLEYPNTDMPNEQISFALLELISNSMRALNERKSDEPIIVDIWTDERVLMFTVSDKGGGFDPASLPCPLDADVDSVNVMSSDFGAYRQRCDFKRFGIGLVAVRKFFPIFELKFVDNENNEVAWPSTSIVGTIISIGLPLAR